MYIGDMDQATADLITQIRKMTVVPNLKKMIYKFTYDIVRQSIEEHRSILSILKESGEDTSQYIAELRDYQTVGTAFMYFSRRSIIGDGVGLGKTVEVAALFNLLRQRGEMTRFLMAVENSAIGQTLVEMIQFTGMNIIAMPNEKRKIIKTIETTDWKSVDGIIVCHSTLKSDALSNWIAQSVNENGIGCKLFNVFILDESSVIKNDKTQIYEYTRNIANLCYRVHFMNATIFETRLMDIYYQVDMLDESLMPTKYKIEKQFCTYSRNYYWITEYDKQTRTRKPVQKFHWDMTGYKNQMQFKELLKLFYFGRCKKDVGIDLPHVYRVYSVEPSQNQKIAIANGHRYNEVLNCPSLIPELGIETNAKSVPKLKRLVELVTEEFDGEKVMVYCFHKEAQQAIKEELEKKGRKPVILNGDTKTLERTDMQYAFNNGEYDVIITSIKKSLNLHGGSVCILYSMETNVAKMEQIRGRIDRNVDDSIKTFIMMYYKDTGEDAFIHTVIKQRAQDSRDLTIDAETAANEFMKVLD